MKNFGKSTIIAIWLFLFSLLSFNYDVAAQEKNNIEQSYLIERYLVNHKDNIIEYAKKYKFNNDKDFKDKLSKIDYFIQSLRALQNDWEKSSISISKTLEEIKSVNEEVRVLLLNKKAEYDKNLNVKKKTYWDLWKSLSKQLDSVYIKIYDADKLNNNKLSDREKLIKTSLTSLKLLSKEMEYFWLKEFDTEEEMETSFLWAINSIKYHILVIKHNL